MFHRVLAVWHHKAKLKVKALEQPVTEVMPLNHAELTHRFLANCKLHTTHRSQSYTKPAQVTLINSQ